MRIHPARHGATAALAFVPALVSLWAANWFHILLGSYSLLMLRHYGSWMRANQVANTVLLGVVALAYTVWIFAVARRWVTMATGSGFVIAAHGLILRLVVELPQSLIQITLAETPPPEPYHTTLVLGRAFGLVAYVMGLGFVAAAVVAERRLQPHTPWWAAPPSA